MNHRYTFLLALLATAALPVFHNAVEAADKYVGRCNVVFEGDSTLDAFAGDITNVPLTVTCTTNSAGEALLNTRIEIGPRQLTTHNAKRDANMYRMFQSDLFTNIVAVVSSTPLAKANLSPSNSSTGPGSLPVELTICGTTNEVLMTTVNPRLLADGWEFELKTNLSLKDFKLKPPSALLGIISVRDIVKVKAHVKLQKEPP